MTKGKAIGSGIVRYLLGCIMMAYGVTKIMQTQFVILPFDVWQQPLEEVWGGSLAWAFLGYSSWFQVLLGFCELIPAILLLFRRTALPGAVMMLPMTLSVMLINYALHLWPQTQILSTFLFMLNVSFFLFERERISLLLEILLRRTPAKSASREAIINTALIIVLLFAFSFPLFNYRSQHNELLGDWFHKHPNEWSLIRETVNDSLLPPKKNKLFFMPYNTYSMINDTTKMHRGRSEMPYELDEKEKTLMLFPQDKKVSIDLLYYKLKGDSLLELSRKDNAGNVYVQVYRKRVMNAK